jgi:hypothetical protein
MHRVIRFATKETENPSIEKNPKEHKASDAGSVSILR